MTRTFRTPEQLREDLLAIWRAGVDGVRPERLVPQSVQLVSPADNSATIETTGHAGGVPSTFPAAMKTPISSRRQYNCGSGWGLQVQDDFWPLDAIRRILVCGAGKGAGEMAAALENVLEPAVSAGVFTLNGWVNVPDDCVRPLRWIHLHGARPTGCNEPTERGVIGTQKILQLCESATETDLVIVVLTGGGSALLPAPIPQISLTEKIEIVRKLSGSGANIEEINTVRRELSAVKGGKLLDHCRAAAGVISLILSDVPGDSLAVIASGPTFPVPANPAAAAAVLEKYGIVAECGKLKVESGVVLFSPFS